jgi:ribulose-phosphate 3-epimerase
MRRRRIHFDVMDGNFVPPITFGAAMARDLKKHTSLPLDVHLMVADPSGQAEQFAAAGVHYITIHYEAPPRSPGAVLYPGRRYPAGISLNPGTPAEVLEDVLCGVDRVLVMTVNPGYGGQAFIPEMLPKIARLAAMRAAGGYRFDIEVDGGINAQTARQVIGAGANILVAGSAVFGAADPARAIRELRGEP